MTSFCALNPQRYVDVKKKWWKINPADLDSWPF